jgi:hypothetical protein
LKKAWHRTPITDMGDMAVTTDEPPQVDESGDPQPVSVEGSNAKDSDGPTDTKKHTRDNSKSSAE